MMIRAPALLADHQLLGCFAAEIDAALAEADDPAVRHVSHADAMAQLDAALTRATRSACPGQRCRRARSAS